jgi:hypothetical protein
MANRHSCEIVDIEARPGMTLRALEQEIGETYFRDFGEFETRIVRAALPGGNGALRLDLYAGRDMAPTKMTEAALYAFEGMGWLGAGPDMRLLNGFLDLPETKEFFACADDVLNLQCNDAEGFTLASVALTACWHDFLVKSAPHVFARDIYHQLLWLEAVNSFQDDLMAHVTPLETIPLQEMYGYLGKAKENCRRELLGGKVISLKSREALRGVQDLFDKCLHAFNGAAGPQPLPPGMLGAYVDILINDYGIGPEGKAPAGKGPAPRF